MLRGLFFGSSRPKSKTFTNYFAFVSSHEVLVHCGMSFNNESSVAGSSRSLNRNVSSPTSNHTEDPTFWVPAGTSTGVCSDIPSGWLGKILKTYLCAGNSQKKKKLLSVLALLIRAWVKTLNNKC